LINYISFEASHGGLITREVVAKVGQMGQIDISIRLNNSSKSNIFWRDFRKPFEIMYQGKLFEINSIMFSDYETHANANTSKVTLRSRDSKVLNLILPSLIQN
jgi:glutamate formiminotransferase